MNLEKVKLTILQEDIYKYLSKIWIFFGNQVIFSPNAIAEVDEISSKMNFGKTFDLYPGDYTIRVEINGQFEDTNITLKENQKYKVVGKSNFKGKMEILAPELYSSIPLTYKNKFASSHEYYVYPAVEISRKNTFKIEGLSENNGLFIFFRYPNIEVYDKKFKGKKPIWSQFNLFDRWHNLICNLNSGGVTSFRGKDDCGYIGFSADLTPGNYFLEYRDKNERRTIAIYVYKKWYTQIFMTIADKPLFDTLKFYISATKGFDPNNIFCLYTDICLTKIQNRDYFLDNDLIHRIAYGKFESPLLGILGAFLYLFGKEIQSSDELFKQIVHNLQHRILKGNESSQDLYALNLLSLDKFQKTVNPDLKLNIQGTPMLRVAFDVIRKVSAKKEWVIPMDSLNDRIAENQYFDSPLNTFKTFYESVKEDKRNRKKSRRNKMKADRENARKDSKFMIKSVSKFQEISKLKTNFEDVVFNQEAFQKIMIPDISIQNILDNEMDRKLTDSVTYSIASGLPFQSNRIINRVEKKQSEPKKLNHIKVQTIGFKKDHSAVPLFKRFQDNPEEIGRVGMAIVNTVINNTGITDSQIADQLNLPISTIVRLRNRWDIFE